MRLIEGGEYMRKFKVQQIIEYIYEHSPEGKLELDPMIHVEFYQSFLWHIDNYKSGCKVAREISKASKVLKKAYVGKKCIFCRRTNFLMANGYCDCLSLKYKEAWIKKSNKLLLNGDIEEVTPLDFNNIKHRDFAIASYSARRGCELHKIQSLKRKYNKR